MESGLEKARLPIEAISPSGNRDHVRAENRLRTYFAPKKLTMPGSYVPRIISSGRTQRMQVILLPVNPKHNPEDLAPKKFPTVQN
ncbi:unnamed protein product [Caenorhabditis brenneri]